jgi:hypothetical protein
VTNLARQLDANFNINTPDPEPGTPQSRRPLRNIAPGVVNATYGDTTGVGDYHSILSLQVTVERRFQRGLAWLGAYTYSHSIDNVPTQQGGGLEGPVPQDIRYRFLDRGSSSFDIRHRTSQSIIYDLPFGRERRFEISNPIGRAIVGGWQVNGILTIPFSRGGLPFTPVLTTSVSAAGSSRPDRLTSGQLSDPTLTHGFDTSFNVLGSAWATPRQLTYGNGGRNILRGPGRTNLDCSVFREERIAERYGIQFRGEFFNIFNHPQFDLPNATIGSAAARVISSTVGSPWDIQLSWRLMFSRAVIILLAWPVVRRTLAEFQGSEVRCPAGEGIRDVRQDHATINRGRARFEPEVEVLRLVKHLNLLQILRIQSWHVDKDVVVHKDAMLFLMCHADVFLERRESARFECPVRSSAVPGARSGRRTSTSGTA